MPRLSTCSAAGQRSGEETVTSRRNWNAAFSTNSTQATLLSLNITSYRIKQTVTEALKVQLDKE
jgi:hypothetical protein